MKIVERMFILLDEKGKKAADLARFLGVTTSVTSTWKSRGTNPPSEYIAQICEFLNVSTDFLLTGEMPNNNSSISIFEKLSESDLEIIHQYAQYLLHKDEFLQYKEEKEKKVLHSPAKEQERVSTSTIKEPIPIFQHTKEETGSEKENSEEQNFLPVLGYTAAGEPIEVPDDIYSFDDLVAIPSGIKADFALTVRGDSMEPDIPNGSTVAVKKQETVENGQIAIVSLNNHITCKTFRKYNGTISLHSINRKYDPITIKEEDNIEVKIIGRVVR